MNTGNQSNCTGSVWETPTQGRLILAFSRMMAKHTFKMTVWSATHVRDRPRNTHSVQEWMALSFTSPGVSTNRLEKSRIRLSVPSETLERKRAMWINFTRHARRHCMCRNTGLPRSRSLKGLLDRSRQLPYAWVEDSVSLHKVSEVSYGSPSRHSTKTLFQQDCQMSFIASTLHQGRRGVVAREETLWSTLLYESQNFNIKHTKQHGGSKVHDPRNERPSEV